MGWEISTIGEVLEKIVGGGTPSKQRSDYWNGTIPWASVKDMADGQYKLSNTKDSITKEGLNNSASNLIPSGNVIISTRMGLGRVYINEVDMAINQDLKALFPKEGIDKEYLLWYIASIAKKLEALGSGTTVKGIRLEQLKSLKFIKPPINTQQQIAAILSAYDDLIENNLRRIIILEEMAQNLYREWFVNFRFPGHENTRFVDSPLGQIPEGWEVEKVGDLLGKLKRVASVPKSNYEVDGLYPVIDQGKDFIGGYTNDEESIISNDLPLIVFGDHTRVLKYIDFPFARGADGTQLLKSNNDRMPMSLFYYSILSIDLSSYAYARHFKFLKDEKVLLPDIATAGAFDIFLSPILDNIMILMKKNDILRQTRDLLLPKLISGEVDVSDLDINVPEEVAI